MSRRSSMNIYTLLVLLFALVFITPEVSGAQEFASGPDESGALKLEAPFQMGPESPFELEAFMDGLMEVLLDEYNTAGAVVSVVRGGEVFFTKGYGYADWEARIPVDPETTLFRIGSVSKLFVWTSVMQMVEQGLLDLDTDVNEYLDFEIPPTFEKPVTLSDIMAHAGGFEDRVFALFTDGSEPLTPLGEIFLNQLPARVRPAGDITSYSNHATGLAAYIVERAVGTDWNEYIEASIMEPLGMKYASFRQPLPDNLEPFMSKGYELRGNRFEAQDFEYVPLYPVGAAAVSGGDMARFMMAHLNLGEYEGQRILNEETARLMQADHHTQAPGMAAMVHGFADHSRNGERVIGHGGDTRLFHSGLWLFPEYDLGLFVSFNSAGSGGARGHIYGSFMDRYFPVDEEVLAPPEDFTETGQRFAGEYRANRFAHTTLARLGAVETQSISVTTRNTLRAMGAEWIQAEPLVFKEQFGSRTLFFREDDTGAITHFFISTTPYMAMERVPPSDRPMLNMAILVLALTSMVLSLVLPVVGWIIRHWHKIPAEGLRRIPRGARITLQLAAVLFLVGLVMLIPRLVTGKFASEPVPLLGLALLFPVLAVIPTLGSVFYGLRMWVKGEGRPMVRRVYLVAAVSLCLFVWQLNHWNLLGWKY
jgi:CubicO group peptidase (beta-lactamase class C family)